jgi:hypothetical protein
MVTFTINNIPQMLAYIPYMDPMGFCWMELEVYGENYLLIGSTAISGKTCFSSNSTTKDETSTSMTPTVSRWSATNFGEIITIFSYIFQF